MRNFVHCWRCPPLEVWLSVWPPIYESYFAMCLCFCLQSKELGIEVLEHTMTKFGTPPCMRQCLSMHVLIFLSTVEGVWYRSTILTWRRCNRVSDWLRAISRASKIQNTNNDLHFTENGVGNNRTSKSHYASCITSPTRLKFCV